MVAMPSQHADIAIIGAGAAGLMAAIHAHRTRPDARIVLLDGARKIGAKILVAGGGRCNVTHHRVTPDDYATSSASRNQLKRVLASFSVRDTIAFFEDLGVKLKQEDTGKLFPITDKARTVLNALSGALPPGCLHNPWRVTSITPTPDGFHITSDNAETLQANRVILCAGGKALPSSGSDGSGLTLAQSLGHSLNPTWPALAPLTLPKDHWLTQLSGTALPAELQVSEASGKIIWRFTGDTLLTHFGLSGPAPMNASRHLAADPTRKLHLRLLPNLTSFEVADAWLQAEATAHPTRQLATALQKAGLPARLAQALPEHAAQAPADTALNQLPRDARRTLAHALSALPIPVTGNRGYKYAEATAGGVPLSEMDLKTMQSQKQPGLFLAGEILDVDGRIGGFNFQWAWCTGRLAGMHATQDKTAN